MIVTTGKRKSSVAKVFLSDGSGVVMINKTPLEVFYPLKADQDFVLRPLSITAREGVYNINVVARGGGTTGQKGAIRHGISRALLVADPELRASLKGAKLLTRDPRVVQSKRYGRKKARKKFQFSKR